MCDHSCMCLVSPGVFLRVGCSINISTWRHPDQFLTGLKRIVCTGLCPWQGAATVAWQDINSECSFCSNSTYKLLYISFQINLKVEAGMFYHKKFWLAVLYILCLAKLTIRWLWHHNKCKKWKWYPLIWQQKKTERLSVTLYFPK